MTALLFACFATGLVIGGAAVWCALIYSGRGAFWRDFERRRNAALANDEQTFLHD